MDARLAALQRSGHEHRHPTLTDGARQRRTLAARIRRPTLQTHAQVLSGADFFGRRHNPGMSFTWREFRPCAPPVASDPVAALRAQLAAQAPLWRALAACHATRRPLLVLMNDSDRATQSRLVLCLLAELLRQRWPAEAPPLHALIATGTHRYDAAQRAAFERATFHETGLVFEEIAWHDAHDPREHITLGGFGFNRRMAAHAHVLAIGSVEPHYFAGLTGAHKTCTIGVLSRDDIAANHAGALDPASDVFALAGNPVHDGIVRMLAALRTAGIEVHAVNELLMGEQLVQTAVGPPLEATLALAEGAARLYRQAPAVPADLAVLHVEGPLAKSLYQADKAIKNNHRAVRDGGVLILDAACHEGVGPAAFFELLRAAPTYAAAVAEVARRGYRLGDHKAVKLRRLTDPAARGVHLALVAPGLSKEAIAGLDARVFAGLPAALEWAASVGSASSAASAYRIHDAGNLVVQPAP